MLDPLLQNSWVALDQLKVCRLCDRTAETVWDKYLPSGGDQRSSLAPVPRAPHRSCTEVVGVQQIRYPPNRDFRLALTHRTGW